MRMRHYYNLKWKIIKVFVICFGLRSFHWICHDLKQQLNFLTNFLPKSVSFPAYQTTVGILFFLFPLFIIHSTLTSQVFCLYISDPICPSLSLSLCPPLSGIQDPKLLLLQSITSRVTSSLSLTFRVTVALGKCWNTDLLMQGMVELLQV